jgi:uncharacterized protein (DUF58 family)
MEELRDKIAEETRRRIASMQGPAQAPPIIPSAAVPPVIPVHASPPVPQLPPKLPPMRGKTAGQSLLTIEELERFKNLLVFAKAVVEGYFSGKHKSPDRGSSAEFADYKEYVAGDDVARIDWRAFGRTKRLFVRQYEEETDMVVYLLVDASASMRYAGEKRPSKFCLAAKIAAALSYLMIHQVDKAALGLFADTLLEFLPPGGTRRHLNRMVTELERVQPSSTTGMAKAIGECQGVFKKRGRLVVISDFLDDTATVFDALGQFVHRKFEILLLHVVDPDELHLPPSSVAKFIDLETNEEVQVDPDEIRPAYRENMKQFIELLGREAELRQISYSLVDTTNPYLEPIEAYLGFRGRNPTRMKQPCPF